MGKVYEALSDVQQQWLAAQPVFFVASAPRSADGHVNCSPKGLDTLRILGERRVAYLDFTGSSAETIAHLRDGGRESGRITLMFCAFSGPPRILRLYGQGRVVAPSSAEWPALRARFPDYNSVRAIIDVAVTRIADSCGYGVPIMALQGERDTLPRWALNKGDAALVEYRALKNARSIDGLPAWRAEDEGPPPPHPRQKGALTP